MLTRLKVNGFKNLVDVDVRFGPLTVLAGENGAGKSNLLDAIRFLSALSHMSLTDAALSVRGEGGHNADIRGLFTRVGDDHVREMTFEAEMIVPHAVFTSAFDVLDGDYPKFAPVCYFLKLGWIFDDFWQLERLAVLEESLNIGFSTIDLNPHVTELLQYDVTLEFASVNIIEAIQRASDEKTHNKYVTKYKNPYSSTSLRTTSNAKTAVAANELEWFSDDFFYRSNSDVSDKYVHAVSPGQAMRSWQIFDFSPADLRRPSPLYAIAQRTNGASRLMSATGADLPAELYVLMNQRGENGDSKVRVRNQLTDLLRGVRDVWIERDDRREELYLMMTDANGVKHPARSLSDGTLRYIALATLMQRTAPELICIEEIENGVHPQRLANMLQMLRDSVVDTQFPVDAVDNPLRQVIVTTHSPTLVQQVAPDELVFARSATYVDDNKEAVRRVTFASLEDTWRDGDKVSIGDVLTYLNPVSPFAERTPDDPERLVDRDDLRDYWLPTAEDHDV